MVTFEFTVEDLARTRFAISPMWELVQSVRALVDPARAAVHLPWLAELKDGRLSGLDLSAAVAFVPAIGYIPDFLTPPPESPLGNFEDELALVRATPDDQVRSEVETVFRDRDAPPVLRQFLDDPGGSVARLTETFESYWELALEPCWPRIRALLEADIAYRAGRLTAGGPAALFEDLYQSVTWCEDRLEVNQIYQEDCQLRGRGLLLMPSAFGWQRTMTITTPPWQPSLIYPARGVAMLWEPGDQTPEGLSALVGRTRADVLASLDAPRSTTELAECLGVTPGGASQHISVLRAAGLVSGRREGRSVLYVRTPLADRLVKQNDRSL
jgi:hypothetical protein